MIFYSYLDDNFIIVIDVDHDDNTILIENGKGHEVLDVNTFDLNYEFVTWI